MKKNYLIALLLLACVSVTKAQSKIDAPGMAMLEDYRECIDAVRTGDFSKTRAVRSSEKSIIPTVTVIVTLNNENFIDGLDIEEVEMLDRRQDMAIVRMPLDKVEQLAQLPAVHSISFGAKNKPLMDKAREHTGVNDLHGGKVLEQPYKGAGVVLGMMDQGVDPNHKAFNDANGVNRVSRLWMITGQNSNVMSYETPSDIAAFETDDATTTHGTHVAGIMGGSYNGAGRCTIEQTNASTGVVSKSVKSKIQYWGMAPEADLALACGEFYDANILLGISKIIDYANEQGKPAVVNLSLGGNIGAHDGTDEMEQYLAKLGEEAIICIASGNEGGDPMSITKTFTASDNQIKTLLLPVTAEAKQAVGIFEAWSDSGAPLEVSFVIYDTTTGNITYKRDVTGANSGVITLLPSTASELGAAWISGSRVQMQALVQSSNNRYRFYSTVAIGQNDARYIPGFIINGNAGTTVECFTSDLGMYSNGVSGYTSGNGDNSANVMCTGDNIISVGSWTTKNKYYSADGKSTWSAANIVDDISSFSSYGTQLLTGKSIPDIAAPGAAVISAYSKYYVKNVWESQNTATSLAGWSPASDPTDYWHALQGTSMATPCVSGIVALMLQADPALDVHTVRNILMTTATAPTASRAGDVRWGAGKVNALEAVKKVLDNKAAIGTVWEDGDERMVITPVAGGYEVFIAGENEITLTLHDMQGRRVASVRGTDGMATIATNGLAKGIYILTAKGTAGSYTRKIAR